MLQQTQVERVTPYYKTFLKQFLTVRSLSRAPLSSVLRAWQGLGYNRRAKMLHEAAKEIAKRGSFPKKVTELERLPGIGPYTARAICAFAYNQNVVFVETNIRTALIHHFFRAKTSIRNGSIYGTVSDAALTEILERLFPKGRAREWYAALMDYGAYLKATGIKTNARVKGYIKQKKFAGSDREARGAIVRALSARSLSATTLSQVLGRRRQKQVRAQIEKLIVEGLIEKPASRYRLAG